MPQQFMSWWDFNRFTASVRERARFVHDAHVTEFLETLYETSTTRHRTIPAGRIVWRAQLGHATEERSQDDVVWDEQVPYAADRMKPMRFAAHEGRVNPKGIPCLYVSNEKKTAMAEVRPWLGAMVSIAQLKLNKEICLIDFSVGHGARPNFYFEEPEPSEREKSIWEQVDCAFSEPAAQDVAVAEYAPTQIISEFFMKKGFDGVVYKSNFGEGFNIALFDLEVADVVNCALCRTKGVAYDFGDSEKGFTITHKET